MAEVLGVAVEDFIELDADEVALLILPRLRAAEANGQALSGWNFILNLRAEATTSGADESTARRVAQTVGEAWQWLCSEGFLAPHPDHHGEWMMLTRAGQRADPTTFLGESRGLGLLRHSELDPALREQVYPLMRRGQHDLAVMAALRLVEDRVRQTARIAASVTGSRPVMEGAFGSRGRLRDRTLTAGQTDPRLFLFSGAMGVFRNPPSHAPLSVEPAEAAEVILFANALLREVERARVARRRRSGSSS